MPICLGQCWTIVVVVVVFELFAIKYSNGIFDELSNERERIKWIVFYFIIHFDKLIIGLFGGNLFSRKRKQMLSKGTVIAYGPIRFPALALAYQKK